MSGMGPPPKPAATKRRGGSGVAMTKLPSEGRRGDTPEWPMGCDAPVACEQIWDQLWTTPQAVAWEHLGIGTVRVVARYAIVLALAEDPFTDATAAARAQAEARQLEDRLGLSPMAMLRLRWEIAADEVAEQRTARTEQNTAADPRRRLRIVDPAAASG